MRATKGRPDTPSAQFFITSQARDILSAQQALCDHTAHVMRHVAAQTTCCLKAEQAAQQRSPRRALPLAAARKQKLVDTHAGPGAAAHVSVGLFTASLAASLAFPQGALARDKLAEFAASGLLFKDTVEVRGNMPLQRGRVRPCARGAGRGALSYSEGVMCRTCLAESQALTAHLRSTLVARTC